MKSATQVILLGTGEVEKLRPLTETMPPAMVPIVNRPVMEHTIELLARQGYKNIIVALHYLGGSIEAHFGAGRRWGVELEYILQRDQLGSAGTLRWSQQSLNETFVVLPADTLFDINLDQLVAQHHAHGGIATVVTHRLGTNMQRTVGLDGAGRVTSLAEQASGREPWYNTGIYVFDAKVFDYILPRTNTVIHDDLLPALLKADEPIHAFQLHGYWNPLDTFQAYQSAQNNHMGLVSDAAAANEAESPRYGSIIGEQISPGIWVGRNNVIHPSAKFTGPVCIGDNCQIGREVELGPNTVIGSNVIIADEATVNQSTILDNTYVGQLVNIEDRFVNKRLMIDACTAENTPVVDGFLLGESTPEMVGGTFRRFFDWIVAFTLFVMVLPLTLILALIGLMTTGRLFTTNTYVGRPPNRPDGPPLTKTHTFSLLHLSLPEAYRKRYLHRITELWNVLRGDMALVGVKPLTPEEAAQVTEEWQNKRYDYLAGMTGLWYIKPTHMSELDEIIVNDAFYVATRRFKDDLLILWQTPAAWWQRCRKDNAALP